MMNNRKMIIMDSLWINVIYTDDMRCAHKVKYKTWEYFINDFDIDAIDTYLWCFDYSLYNYILSNVWIWVSIFDIVNPNLNLVTKIEQNKKIYHIFLDEFWFNLKKYEDYNKAKDFFYKKLTEKYNNLSKFAKIVIPKPIKI